MNTEFFSPAEATDVLLEEGFDLDAIGQAIGRFFNIGIECRDEDGLPAFTSWGIDLLRDDLADRLSE